MILRATFLWNMLVNHKIILKLWQKSCTQARQNLFFWLPSYFVESIFQDASSGSKSILLNTEVKNKAAIKIDINTENLLLQSWLLVCWKHMNVCPLYPHLIFMSATFFDLTLKANVTIYMVNNSYVLQQSIHDLKNRCYVMPGNTLTYEVGHQTNSKQWTLISLIRF